MKFWNSITKGCMTAGAGVLLLLDQTRSFPIVSTVSYDEHDSFNCRLATGNYFDLKARQD